MPDYVSASNVHAPCGEHILVVTKKLCNLIMLWLYLVLLRLYKSVRCGGTSSLVPALGRVVSGNSMFSSPTKMRKPAMAPRFTVHSLHPGLKTLMGTMSSAAFTNSRATITPLSTNSLHSAGRTNHTGVRSQQKIHSKDSL